MGAWLGLLLHDQGQTPHWVGMGATKEGVRHHGMLVAEPVAPNRGNWGTLMETLWRGARPRSHTWFSKSTITAVWAQTAAPLAPRSNTRRNLRAWDGHGCSWARNNVDRSGGFRDTMAFAGARCSSGTLRIRFVMYVYSLCVTYKYTINWRQCHCCCCAWLWCSAKVWLASHFVAVVVNSWVGPSERCCRHAT